MKEIARISVKTMGWRKKTGLLLMTASVIFTFPFLEEWLGLRQVFYDFGEAMVFSGQMLVVAILVIILHEGIHGALFKLYTKRVKFGVKFDKVFWIMPYATSPGCKLRRGQLICVALAPQIATVILLVVSISISVGGALPRLLFWMAMCNFAGGAMDIYMSIWLLKFKSGVLVEDRRDGAIIYEEAK